MRTWRPLSLVVLFVVVAGLTAAGLYAYSATRQASAIDLVLRAQRARLDVTAKGTARIRTYTRQGLTDIRAVVHRGNGDLEIAYLDGPVGGARVGCRQGRIWRSGGPCRCDRRIDVAGGLAELDEERIAENYVARVAGEGEVAGRRATHVVLRQRDGCAGVDLWVDAENGFPLRTTVVDAGGRSVSDTVYETIDYSVGPPPAEQPVQRRADLFVTPTTPGEVPQLVGFEFLKPTYLPPGFVEEGYFVHRFCGGRKPAIEIRHSDGLAVLSVVEMQTQGTGACMEAEGCSGSGPGMGQGGHGQGSGRHMPRRLERTAQAFGGAATIERDGVIVVVMGQVSADELQRVADSVR